MLIKLQPIAQLQFREHLYTHETQPYPPLKYNFSMIFIDTSDIAPTIPCNFRNISIWTNSGHHHCVGFSTARHLHLLLKKSIADHNCTLGKISWPQIISSQITTNPFWKNQKLQITTTNVARPEINQNADHWCSKPLNLKPCNDLPQRLA
jgi:hypothetical protein